MWGGIFFNLKKCFNLRNYVNVRYKEKTYASGIQIAMPFRRWNN